MRRSVLAIGAWAAAYGLLRGYPQSWEWWPRAIMAVGLLGLALVIWQRRQVVGAATLRGGRGFHWRDLLVPLGLFVMLELGLLVYFKWVPPQLGQGAERIEAWLRPAAAEERRRAELETEQSATRGGGNWLWDDRPQRSLPMRADFRLGNRPQIYLTPAEGGPDLIGQRLYLHAFALDEYADGTWRVRDRAREQMVAGNDGWLTLQEVAASEVIRAQVYHGSDAAGRHPLVGLQGVFAARVDQATRVGPGFHLLPASDQAEGTFRYETMSRPLGLDEIEADGQTTNQISDPSNWADNLRLPRGETGRRLEAQAISVSGESGAVDQLRRIRDHLRDSLDYSLVIENPENRAPLENFLFHEQRGHCEFFATSAALMARAVGVPSRMCYGWAGGTYFHASKTFVFRASEAHAWAEVWLPEHGWVVMDATPPDGLDQRTPRTAGAGQSLPPMAAEDNNSMETDAPMPGYGWWLAWIVIIGPGALLVWQFWRPQAEAALPPRDAQGRATLEADYWRWFERGCRARGLRSTTGQTLQSLLAQLDTPPPEARALRDYHYAVRYEGAPADRARERALKRSLKQWAQAASR